jgi:hypothetical protein
MFLSGAERWRDGMTAMPMRILVGLNGKPCGLWRALGVN